MNKLLAVAGVAVLAFGGWRLWTHERAQVDDTSLIADRLWIDHIPKNERDIVNVFVVLSDDELGIFQASSAWKIDVELFKHEGRGGDFRFVFPQTGTKEKVRAKARECHQGGMDYCLEITGSDHGVKRYYSNEGWEVGSLDAEQQLVKKLAH